MIDLSNKTALVTGGSRGIGQSIVLTLAKAGCKVCFTSRSEASGQATLALAKEQGYEVHAIAGDVANFESCQEITASAIEKMGSLDILVNNAGITKDNLFLKMKPEEWEAVIDTNLTGLFNSCKAVMKPMFKARKGRIINIGSVVGHTGNAGQVNYCSSKAGLIGFTKSLALETAARNITVNAISPGFIATEMTYELTEDQKTSLLQKIPLKRMGSAEDISGAVLYLASDLAGYITGTVLHVNGGMY